MEPSAWDFTHKSPNAGSSDDSDGDSDDEEPRGPSLQPFSDEESEDELLHQGGAASTPSTPPGTPGERLSSPLTPLPPSRSATPSVPVPFRRPFRTYLSRDRNRFRNELRTPVKDEVEVRITAKKVLRLAHQVAQPERHSQRLARLLEGAGAWRMEQSIRADHIIHPWVNE